MVGYNTDDTSTPGQLNPWSSPRLTQLGSFTSGGYLGNDFQKLMEATDPLEHKSSTPPVSQETGIGPGMSFGNTMLSLVSDNITLIPCAYQGTSVTQWAPGGDGLFDFCVNQTNFAIASVPGARFGGILWLQGETDAQNGMSSSTYAALLQSMVSSFRVQITGASASSPFVVAHMVPLYTANLAGGPSIQAVLTNISQYINYSSVVLGYDDTGSPLAFGSFAPPIHYSAASCRYLGVHYAYGIQAAKHRYVGSVVPGRIVQLFISGTNVSWTYDPVAVLYNLTWWNQSTSGYALISNATSISLSQIAPGTYNLTCNGVGPTGVRGLPSAVGTLVVVPPLQQIGSAYPSSVPSLAVRLVGDSLSGLTSGSSVTSWTDSSPNAYVFQPSSSPAPQFYSVNGHGLVRFSGSGGMTSPLAFPYTATNVTFAMAVTSATQTVVRQHVLHVRLGGVPHSDHGARVLCGRVASVRRSSASREPNGRVGVPERWNTGADLDQWRADGHRVLRVIPVVPPGAECGNGQRDGSDQSVLWRFLRVAGL